MMASKFHGGNKGKDKLLMDTLIKWLVPRVYASIACELWDVGFTAEKIQEIFLQSQIRWQDSVRNGWDMLKNVQEVTGIEVEYFKETGNIINEMKGE